LLDPGYRRAQCHEACIRRLFCGAPAGFTQEPALLQAVECLLPLQEAFMTNPKSTAQIAGHPIHPMLIPFPVACFVLTFVSDVTFWKTSNDFWASASLWLLGIGLIMAALAAVMGMIDLMGDDRIRNLNDAWLHAGGNVIAVVIELYNWYSRYEHGTSAIIPTGLVLSLIVVLILLFTGWKGWEMVYREHVGVTDVADQAR
jgi:uncharacterized membrane protein